MQVIAVVELTVEVIDEDDAGSDRGKGGGDSGSDLSGSCCGCWW